MGKKDKKEILKHLREQIEEKRAILITSAGCGLSAKCEDIGGADLIVVENTGKFRMAGHGSIGGFYSYGNANDTVVKMAGHILPVVKNAPVIAGVCATDPFKNIDTFLNQIVELGFSGVLNYPSGGNYDDENLKNMEKLGMGYSKEVEMVKKANELGLLTIASCWRVEQAVEMANAGADIIIANMGIEEQGSPSALQIDDCVKKTKEIVAGAKTARDDVIVVYHGGAVIEYADIQHMLSSVKGLAGHFATASVDQFPMEQAIAETAQKFKTTKLHARA